MVILEIVLKLFAIFLLITNIVGLYKIFKVLLQ